MYLFFDTETTGLPKDWNAPVTRLSNWPRLVQLGYLLYDAEGNLHGQGNHLIQPQGFTIPKGASRVHGITTEIALEKGQPLDAVLNEFGDMIDSAKFLIGHNISFDNNIVGAEFLRQKMKNPIPSKKSICTMRKSTDFCRISGPYGYKWPTLTQLHKKLFGEGFDGAHDAVADITATARCFWELRKRGVL